MRPLTIRNVALAVATVAMVAAGGAVQSTRAADETKASDADWKAVEEALGKAGAVMPGGVYRVAMPRTDLKVKVEGVGVKPGFALGSYAAFKKMGKDAMVMGDLVLLDEEVNEVMIRLMLKGLLVTAVHNHLNEMSPHVMYMHYTGHGDARQLAAALHEALAGSATPLAAASPPAGGTAAPEIDQKQVETALGRQGRVNGGILQVGIA